MLVIELGRTLCKISLAEMITRSLLSLKNVFNIIGNLIENAVKYSDQSVHVVIDCLLLDHKLMIRVTANGIGIPAAEQSRVFDKFYRGSNIPDYSLPSIDLGLSYVRLLVEAHRGTIIREKRPERKDTPKHLMARLMWETLITVAWRNWASTKKRENSIPWLPIQKHWNAIYGWWYGALPKEYIDSISPLTHRWAGRIIQYYRTRSQIEFCFRDSKRFTDLYHSQARDINRLNFMFNALMTTVNVAKIMMKENRIPFSMDTPKNLMYIKWFFWLSGFKPNRNINAKLVKELIDIV